MKHTLTVFLALFLSGWGLATAQNRTYYYEKVAVVVNGNKTAASGEFIKNSGHLVAAPETYFRPGIRGEETSHQVGPMEVA